MTARARTILPGLLAVALAAWVYWPLLGVWFFADDLLHFASIVNDGFLPFVLRPFGGHNYLVRNLVMYASWHLFGLHAEPYFALVLLIHLLNVWLLFRVLGILTSSSALACLGATIWGTSSIAVGALGWYSVIGHVLLATVLLILLRSLALVARGGGPLPSRTAWCWYALILAGTTLFGLGVGVALAFPVALFLMLPAAWRQPRVRALYVSLPFVAVVLYVALRHLSPLLFEPLSPQELFHQPKGLEDLPRTMAVLGHLMAFAASEYPRRFVAAGGDYPDSITWLVLSLAGAALAWLAWRGTPAARRTAVALMSLSLGMYFTIAIGRLPFAGLPITFAATSLRYHYAPSIPTVIVMCLALQQLGQIGWLHRLSGTWLLLIALAVGVRAYVRSDFRIDPHAETRNAIEKALQRIEREARAAPSGSTVYLENIPNWLPFVENRFLPGRAALFMLAHDEDDIDGRRVRFVEHDPELLSTYTARPESRLGRLLVSPDAVAGGP